MRQRVGLLLVGFVLGIATTLGGMAVTGGWYEYRYFDMKMVEIEKDGSDQPHRQLLREILGNSGGWQLVSGDVHDSAWLKRPRIRLGW